MGRGAPGEPGLLRCEPARFIGRPGLFGGANGFGGATGAVTCGAATSSTGASTASIGAGTKAIASGGGGSWLTTGAGAVGVFGVLGAAARGRGGRLPARFRTPPIGRAPRFGIWLGFSMFSTPRPKAGAGGGGTGAAFTAGWGAGSNSTSGASLPESSVEVEVEVGEVVFGLAGPRLRTFVSGDLGSAAGTTGAAWELDPGAALAGPWVRRLRTDSACSGVRLLS